MKNDEEFKERFGDDPDGVVTRTAISTSPEEGSYVAQVPVSFGDIHETDRSYFVELAGAIFKGLMDQGFDPEKDIDDAILIFEIPAKKFNRQWQAAVDNGRGGFYKVSEDPLTEHEPGGVIPKVVVFDEDRGEDNGE